ncbi:MAG TPA: S8 family serine peptidase, partial [Longimicrobiales bacterium]
TLARRQRNGVGILETDRPISPVLVARLRRAGARIRVLDRWSRSVSAEVDSATAERIARLPWVTRLESVPRLTTAAQPALATAAPLADTLYGFSYSQLLQLDVPAAHALGVNGRGVRIGMLDSGFDRNHAAFRSLRVIAARDFIWGDTIVGNQPKDSAASGNQAFHGTATWSIVGGYQKGRYVGPAYGASFLLAKTEFLDPNNGDTHADEDRWVQGAQWEDSVGVDIISSSLGYRYGFPDGDYTCAQMNGRTTRTSVWAAQLARRRILLVNSMGNEGPAACSISAPADADSIISVGAVDSLGNVTTWSSRGPTGDGRTKPDLVARGINVFYAAVGTDSSYSSGGFGTSWAAPQIAGAAALVLQAWPTFSPMKIRSALTLSANRISPDNNYG